MSMSSSAGGSGKSSRRSGGGSSSMSSPGGSSGSFNQGNPMTIPPRLRNPMFDPNGLGVNFEPWFGTEGFLSRASLMIMARQ